MTTTNVPTTTTTVHDTGVCFMCHKPGENFGTVTSPRAEVMSEYRLCQSCYDAADRFITRAERFKRSILGGDLYDG